MRVNSDKLRSGTPRKLEYPGHIGFQRKSANLMLLKTNEEMD